MKDQAAQSKRSWRLATELRVRYLAALIDCDQVSASSAIDQGLSAGLEVPTLLREVLAPAQLEMGELWHRGEVTIAQEHWGTETTKREVERILLALPPTRSIDRAVVVAAVPGEIHTLPARIVAGLFQWRGWTVHFLGQAPPIEDFVDYIGRRSPDLIALSLVLPVGRSSARDLCLQIRETDAPPPILIGGSGAQGIAPAALGADAVVVEALEGLAVAAGLVGLGAKRDPRAYLDLVGRRIQKVRESLGLSQAELAQKSGLTRPYLSAIERGRQNITLEAGLRIAGALEVGMAELLEEESS